MKCKDLPNELLGLALRRHVEQRDAEDIYKCNVFMDSLLSDCFRWGITPEGREFWQRVNNCEYKKCLDLPTDPPQQIGACSIAITCTPQELMHLLHELKDRGCA